MPLFTATDIADFRTLVADVLTHRYTRVAPGAPGAEDAWGQTTYGADVSTLSVPCLYRPAEKGLQTERGEAVQSAPVLLVAHDDTIAVGDRVRDVADADGAVLLDGPIEVESIEPDAGAGEVLLKRAVLAGAEATR